MKVCLPFRGDPALAGEGYLFQSRYPCNNTDRVTEIGFLMYIKTSLSSVSLFSGTGPAEEQPYLSG
jgi:hypothetical protein